MSRHRIALIGCGAIAEALYLPALKRFSNNVELICVDASEDRARTTAASARAARWTTDYRDVVGDIDGAIVAVPASLHHGIALDCLERGVHVLCEKPLSLSRADAEELIACAERSRVSLAVNNGRRLFPSFREVARLIASGVVGEVRSLEMELGEAFDWPAASASYFGVAAGGRGVLLDVGAHIVDLACWWLGGKPTLVSYADDSLGGTEAYATMEFVRGACTGRITLSWLSRLSNRFTVIGTRGSISGQMYDWQSLTVTDAGQTRRVQLPAGGKTITEVAQGIVENFLDVLAGRATPLIAGRDALPSIALIEECYAQRRRVAMPWYDAMELVVDAR